MDTAQLTWVIQHLGIFLQIRLLWSTVRARIARATLSPQSSYCSRSVCILCSDGFGTAHVADMRKLLDAALRARSQQEPTASIRTANSLRCDARSDGASRGRMQYLLSFGRRFGLLFSLGVRVLGERLFWPHEPFAGPCAGCPASA
jgi:hypothetical protein